MSSSPEPTATASVRKIALKEVRYSLPDMLEEIKDERTTGSFGMEKLEQQDIKKLFTKKPTRRAKSKK